MTLKELIELIGGYEANKHRKILIMGTEIRHVCTTTSGTILLDEE